MIAIAEARLMRAARALAPIAWNVVGNTGRASLTQENRKKASVRHAKAVLAAARPTEEEHEAAIAAATIAYRDIKPTVSFSTEEALIKSVREIVTAYLAALGEHG